RSTENVATRDEQRALTLWTQTNRLDQVRGGHAARTSRIALVRNVDRNRRALARARVEHLQLAIELVHDLIFIVRTGPPHVPLAAARDFRRAPVRYRVSVKIEMTIAIGVEEDRIAEPHRVARRPRTFRDPFRGAALQIENVELVGLPAPVTFFGSKVARLRRVNHLASVRREVAGTGGGHRQRFGWTTIDRN